MKKLTLTVVTILLVCGLIFGACAPAAPSPKTSPGSTPAPAAPPVTKLAPTPEKPLEMKFSYWAAAQAPQPKIVFLPWSAAIEKATNGRIKITQYPSETLVKQMDSYDAAVTGLADIAFIATDSTPGRFPLSEFGSLPDLFPTAPIAARVYNEILNKYCASTELKDIKILYISSYQPFQIFSNKLVQKLEDMKGFRLRTEGKMQDWTMQALGATGVELSMMDTYSGLDKNLVDGCLLQYAGVMAFKIQEVTKYRTEVNLCTQNFIIGMGMKLWNSLPDDIQKAFNDNSGVQASITLNAAFMGADAGAKQAVIAYDKKVGNPDVVVFSQDEKARWLAAVKPVWDRWTADMASKGLPGKVLLDEAVSLVNKYSQAAK